MPVYLTDKVNPSTSKPAAKTPPKPAPTPTPVILYAEDNYLLAQSIKDVLELAGWRVVHCADGSAAVARLILKEHYDLAVIDRELPWTDGLSVVRQARKQEHRKCLPIIVLSLEECAEEARAAGADAFLRKPADLLSLVETVRRLLCARG